MPDESSGQITVAYFSMEVGLDAAMPTYSGGLGVLAGDTLRAAADLDIPGVGVTLLHRKGYFRQHLDALGNQYESPAVWSPEQLLEPMEHRVSLNIEGRQVQLKAWRYQLRGIGNDVVPIYFLDSAVPENSQWDQTLTDYLYGGDDRYRLCQEAVLGFGGVALLRALGYDEIQAYHMNEGHSALLALALLEEEMKRRGTVELSPDAIEAVRRRCVFTTHTPVPAGQDKFPLNLVRQVLGDEPTHRIAEARCCLDDVLNMTYLGLYFSRYVNGVSMRHEDISQDMYPLYPINAITNGVHATTWTTEPFCRLYDRHFPQWRGDNLYLRYAISIPPLEIRDAHEEAKGELFAEVEKRTGIRLDRGAMTVGFARRAAAYKRAELLFSDPERLKRIVHSVGPLQVIYGGKAHPRDEAGKALIRRVFQSAAALKDTVSVVYLEEYDMALAKRICGGVDLWLNTPRKPMEASGTSGMKAALNGVPSLSVLDGWWVEGHVEGVTGWSIGEEWESGSDPQKEVASLYDKLEHVIVPMYYGKPKEYAMVMRSAIAMNASFFNTQRMVLQYLQNAYFPRE